VRPSIVTQGIPILIVTLSAVLPATMALAESANGASSPSRCPVPWPNPVCISNLPTFCLSQSIVPLPLARLPRQFSASVPETDIDTDTSPPDQQTVGPGLSLNLSSNNPFLNPRTGSPALPSPSQLGAQSAPIHQKSTNPFLASFETDLRSNSPPKTMDESQVQTSTQKTAARDDAKELFVSTF
jgi:hypothetical protein